MASCGRNVQNRGAIDGDAKRLEIGGNESAKQPCTMSRAAPVMPVEVADQPRRRTLPPVWRTQPLNPATLLIDQDRRVRIVNAVTQVIDQLPNLRWRRAVPAKQDEAERLYSMEKYTLAPTETLTFAPKDERRTRP